MIGSSIAGLLTAAVMSPYYARVILVEAAPFVDEKSVRKSTPQGHHVHGLLSSGWAGLQELLPGVERRLKEMGAEWVHFGKEFRWHHFGKFKASFEDLMEGPFMSRTCLEAAVRVEVMALENVELRSDSVVGLIGESSELSGVRLASGGELNADTVVDASGRASHCLQWLEEIGARSPERKTITTGLRYSSCRFKVPSNHAAEWKALFVIPKPPETMSGAIFPQEDGNWLVTLAGRKMDSMPTNHEEFLKYAKQLGCPDLFEAIKDAEPLSALAHYRFKESRRYLYENIATPNNFLAIGDSVCSFNPIFGQGMTVCILEALKMSQLMERGECNSKNYFKSISSIVNHAWEMIMVEDMRYPELHSHRSLKSN